MADDDRPVKTVKASVTRELFRNRSFVSLWLGRSVSSFGDACFNVAVLWAVYAETQSTLRTALVQVVWQSSDIVFGPIAGVVADRWDRKRIMIVTNALAACVVAVLALVVASLDTIPLISVLLAIFALNALSTFMNPAASSVMPTILDRRLLSTASGISASSAQIAALVGSSIAGVVIAATSTAWALLVDAVSFLVAALTCALAKIPRSQRAPAIASEPAPTFWHELRDGWNVMVSLPVIKAIVWLGIIVNVASLTGPLFPALIDEQLKGGATEFGLLEAVGIGGGLLGGFLAGRIERTLGAGRILIWGNLVAGVSVVAIAFSTSLAITLVLESLVVFTLVISSISSVVLMQSLIPNEFLGRVFGISRSLVVIVIPASALLGGWAADRIGVVPVYAFGGCWLIVCASIAWTNPHIRNART